MEEVINLGFETDIISLSTWPSFHYTNDALTMDRNVLMQVSYLGQFRKSRSKYLFIWNQDE